MLDKNFRMNDEPDLVKGLVAGVAGGLLASFVMEQFQFAWSKAAEALERSSKERKRRGRKPEPATVKVAQSISKSVLGKSMSQSQKKYAGEAVHYAMGAMSGAIYGAATEALPLTTAGDGLAFGAAVWLLADEVTVPALGFSKSPTEFPLSTHVYALVSHLVYGWTTEMVRRAIRKVL